MISGFVVFLGICLLTVWVSGLFGESRANAFIKGGFAGGIAGIVAAASSKVPAWIAMVFLVVILVMVVQLNLYWKLEGSSWLELVIFILIQLVLMWVSMSAAVRVRDICSIRWVVALLESIPKVTFLASLAFMALDFVWFNYDNAEGGESDDEENC
jgi:hypothetical protein